MFFYIFFIFFVTLLLGLSYFYPEQNKPLQWFVFVIVVAIMGLREYVGYDYASYVDWYINGTRDGKIEFGYLQIMNMFRYLNLSYHFLFFFFSFGCCLFLFLGIKKYTDNQNFAFLIFLLLPELFLTSLSSIRQSFSVSVCFYAFYYLLNRKYIIYTLLMLVAISIHYSALIAFLVFLFVFKYADRFNERNIIVILFVSFLISKIDIIQFFYFLFEKSRYAYYFSQELPPVNRYKVIILNLVALFVLYHFKKLKEKYPYHQYLLPLYFFSVLFINLFNAFADMARLVLYFRVFEIIIIADLLFLSIKKRRLWLVTGFYVYYFAAFAYTLRGDLDQSSGSNLIPYKTFILE